MTKTCRCLVLLLCAVSTLELAAEAKARVGVLDFQANSISKADAQVIGELFSSELVAAKFYDVVDRKNIEKLLAEQEFQLSDCTETSCAVKIGKVLALDYMIYGSVSKLGDTFVINVQLLNVGTAQIEGSSKEKFAKIDEAIDILKRIVYQLAGRELPEDKAAKQPVPAKAGAGAVDAPAAAVSAPARSLFFDLGAGWVFGKKKSGLEVEVNARYMFFPQIGLGIGALVASDFKSGVYAGVNFYLLYSLLPNLKIGAGFRGFPEYINNLGGPTISIYLFDLYARLCYDILGYGGWCFDVGYAL